MTEPFDVEAVRERLRDYGSATLHGGVPARTFGVVLGDVAMLLGHIDALKAERDEQHEVLQADQDARRELAAVLGRRDHEPEWGWGKVYWATERAVRERDEARGGTILHQCAECGVDQWMTTRVTTLVCGACTHRQMEVERDRLAAENAALREEIVFGQDGEPSTLDVGPPSEPRTRLMLADHAAMEHLRATAATVTIARATHGPDAVVRWCGGASWPMPRTNCARRWTMTEPRSDEDFLATVEDWADSAKDGGFWRGGQWHSREDVVRRLLATIDALKEERVRLLDVAQRAREVVRRRRWETDGSGKTPLQALSEAFSRLDGTPLEEAVKDRARLMLAAYELAEARTAWCADGACDVDAHAQAMDAAQDEYERIRAELNGD